MNFDKTIARKKNTGEPGNGGEFGHTVRAEGGIALSVASQQLADAKIDWRVDDGFATFAPSDVGSDYPAHFIDVSEFGVEAGYDISDRPETIDKVTKHFIGDHYDAQVDFPDDDGDPVQLKFRKYANRGIYSYGDAISKAKETKLEEFLTDRESGKFDESLAEYRGRQVVIDIDSARAAAAKYEGTAGLEAARNDAKVGVPGGLVLVVNNTAREARLLTALATSTVFKQLTRFVNTGVCDREEAIKETVRASDLFVRFLRYKEANAIAAVHEWLIAGR